MKVINIECLCRNCKFQLDCKQHKNIIRIQTLAKELGESFTTALIKIDDCKKYSEW